MSLLDLELGMTPGPVVLTWSWLLFCEVETWWWSSSLGFRLYWGWLNLKADTREQEAKQTLTADLHWQWQRWSRRVLRVIRWDGQTWTCNGRASTPSQVMWSMQCRLLSPGLISSSPECSPCSKGSSSSSPGSCSPPHARPPSYAAQSADRRLTNYVNSPSRTQSRRENTPRAALPARIFRNPKIAVKISQNWTSYPKLSHIKSQDISQGFNTRSNSNNVYLTPIQAAPVHHSAVAFAVTSPRRLDSFTHCNTMQYYWKLQRSSAVSIHSTSVRIASLEHLVLGV